MRSAYDQDLFESSKMTFGEHLEELRVALFKSVIALVLGFMVGLLLGRNVVRWIEYPLNRALKAHASDLSADEVDKMVASLEAAGRPIPAWLEAMTDSASEEPFELEEIYVDPAAILEELRKQYPELETLPTPGTASDPDDPTRGLLKLYIARKNVEEIPIISTGIQEPFMIYVKAALVAGALLSSPFVFYFIWEFVAAGLYPHEKKFVYIFMPFSMVLFLAGAALAFFVVFRFVLAFLLGFNSWLGIEPYPRINEWLGFALLLPLGFGISFQLPLVMLFLERIGVFSVEAYLDKWRIAILVVAVLSMVLTPADPGSMILMGLPLSLLYFGGVLLCRFMPKRKSPYD